MKTALVCGVYRFHTTVTHTQIEQTETFQTTPNLYRTHVNEMWKKTKTESDTEKKVRHERRLTKSHTFIRFQ